MMRKAANGFFSKQITTETSFRGIELRFDSWIRMIPKIYNFQKNGNTSEISAKVDIFDF